MTEEKPRYQFGLIHLLAAVFVAALIAAGLRVDLSLGLGIGFLVANATLMILIMARYRWSDIAMSTCIVLFIVWGIIVVYILSYFFPPVIRS